MQNGKGVERAPRMGVGRSYLEWGGPIAEYHAFTTAILRGAIWVVGCVGRWGQY